MIKKTRFGIPFESIYNVVHPEEIGAVYIKGKCIKIRKIIKENNRIMLFSSNENSGSPEVYNLNDSKDIQVLILGRVVELRTKF